MTNKQKAILWTITMPLWIAPAILIVVPFWLTYETALNLLDDGSKDKDRQWRTRRGPL
jgi:hypothetical protein